MYGKRMAGVTLVELIVAMVIVSVALAGLVAVYNRTNIASADPLAAQQMLAIAEATMEEVLLKSFEGDNVHPADRAQFDELDDYQAYGPTAIVDADGVPVPGLERYKVQVQVDRPGVGVVPAVAGVPSNEARRIRVSVSGVGEPIMLTGWRTKP